MTKNLPSSSEKYLPEATEGYLPYRLKSNPSERIFAELFKEDLWQCAIDTLITKARGQFLSYEDKRLAATIIQWLGSPAGARFLQEALREMGFFLVKQPFEEMLTSADPDTRGMGKNLLRLADIKKYKSEFDKELIERFGAEGCKE